MRSCGGGKESHQPKQSAQLDNSPAPRVIKGDSHPATRFGHPAPCASCLPAPFFPQMNEDLHPAPAGRVESLHLHPAESGAPLRSIGAFEVVAEKGISGNGRYFGRLSRSTGKPSRRQVSLMEREQLATHSATLGLE